MIAPVPVIETAVIVAPFAATKPCPSPMSFSIVTVNVCAFPTSFVPVCWIVIRASTHVFWFEMLKAP